VIVQSRYLVSNQDPNGTSEPQLVSLTSMRTIWRSLLVLALTWTISLSDSAQITSKAPVPSDVIDSCRAEGAVLADKRGRPVWLNTDALIKRAIHCTAPQMPAMARQARIEGQVLVNILVDRKGQVACAHLIVGHPMLAGSAIDAAKDWTFRPMKQNGKAVSFYGHLSFHFSTAQTAKGENPCTVAHW